MLEYTGDLSSLAHSTGILGICVLGTIGLCGLFVFQIDKLKKKVKELEKRMEA